MKERKTSGLLLLLALMAGLILPAAAQDTSPQALTVYLSQRVDQINKDLTANRITVTFAAGELDDLLTISQVAQFTFGSSAPAQATSALIAGTQFIAAARTALGASGSAALVSQ